ncbi:MAG: type II secretion system F family protein [Nitrososphaerota archaeon]|nr:type II secretion system F family protein [Nitrososphaerota archaeon]MDG7013213.1 type II secretion system F family protein [Nitrososphaerota archaeon]MDG7026555.1 type II secretion system F family protein [Nitrososphaerota archaeon]
MARVSAGRLYFALLGAAAALVLLATLLGIRPFSGLSAGLALGFVLGEAVVLVALAVLLPLFHVDVESKVKGSAVLEALGRRRAVQVREVREDRAVKIARGIPLLNRLAERMERGIRGDVVKGGMQLDPYAFAARYSFYSVVLAAVFVPLSLVLSVLVSPTLLALMMIPAIILYTPSLSAKNRAAERKTNVRDELPFFALLSSVMQSAGRSLVDAFRGTMGKQILPAMEVEARLLQKSIGFGKDVVGALDDLASTHPDDSFKHFLYGYTGVLKSGGDVVLYLGDRTREYLASMRFRWQSYAERVGTIGEMLIIVFVLLPLLLVVGAITMPPEMVAEIAYASVAALPMISLVMYFMVRSAQPRTYDILGGDARLGLIGLAAGAMAASFTGQLWLTVAVGGAAGAALYGLPVRAQMREVRMTEAALPDFLRSIAEYRKIGYNMRKAVLETAAKTKFNPVFDSILERMAAQMSLGVRLGEVKVAMRSWLGRTTFFILDQITESGGGTPANIEDLYNFISGYNRLKKEATSSVGLYKMLGYAVPVAIPLVVKVISGVIGSFGSSAAGFFRGGTASLAIVNSTVAVVTVVAAGAIAFTMTRATDFTSKNTLNMTVLFALAVLAIVFTRYLPMSFSLGF